MKYYEALETTKSAVHTTALFGNVSVEEIYKNILCKVIIFPQKQKLSEKTEEQTISSNTMQGKLPAFVKFLFVHKGFQLLKCYFFLFSETLEKLSKKEEQCTSLSTESESLRSQLSGGNIWTEFILLVVKSFAHNAISPFLVEPLVQQRCLISPQGSRGN